MLRKSSLVLALCFLVGGCATAEKPGAPARPEAAPYANVHELARAEEWAARDADWRNGAVVYQVLLDRFAPPANLEAKRALYPEPKKLRDWSETPTRGTYVESAEVWSHEIDFWGGDFASLMTKLDYIDSLGVDVLYLNPIHLAYTNHKYDAQDYFEVSPEFGTREDVKKLAAELHKRGRRLVLDGVFNHMGRTSPHFQDALKNPNSPWRDWYMIGSEYNLGYRAWVNVPNLPEVNLESPKVRARIYGDRDSVIQGYLRDGVDGWRLDVAFDIGFRWLSELTEAAHEARPGSIVIGEIWNYPEQWMPALDGVMNMTLREVLLQMVNGRAEPATAARQIERLVADVGTEPMLKSWIILDNHDTVRLTNSLSEPWQREMAQVLQFTLPGSPCLYYGTELGMTGGDDPEQRAPMRWDLVNSSNPTYAWNKQLLALRKSSRALRIGDYRALDTKKTLGFMRLTDRAADTVVVFANPSNEEVTEFVTLRDSKIMSYSKLKDALHGTEFTVMAGTLTITVPARAVFVLRPVIEQTREYTPYKRVQ